MPNVAINGFGRIGRALFKILVESSDLGVVAINDLAPIENLAYLLRYDTVYGRYGKRVVTENDALLVDGTRYPFYSETDPARLPWRQAGVDLVFECTGVFSKRPQLEPHLKARAQHVLLSAPGKDEEIVTVVHGVNRPPDGQDRIGSSPVRVARPTASRPSLKSSDDGSASGRPLLPPCMATPPRNRSSTRPRGRFAADARLV